ncbi:hypothetical protein K32_35370 [Kaistia sp. 32K]|uniref:hypothetical protein n=1 Tax=Kaistia sp. 32K TaxID=2795690 RepID=UPI0019159C8D|nr:hypothetical protein [Kaistia sp. 32K]BCP54920.1 hypothetical protein K32_35370 [Kaistia sp. 32K]
MTDYYAVLKKAVSGFDSESGDARRSVYDKARTALIAQLKSIDPPLTTSEISRQRLELEEAIRKVEREASVARAAPVRISAAAAVAEALGTAPEPEPAEAQDPEPEEEQEEAVSPPPPPPPPPPAPKPVLRQAEPARPAPVPTPRAPVPAPVLTPPPPPISLEEEALHHDDVLLPEELEPEWHEPEPEPAPAPLLRQPAPIQPQWPQVTPKPEFTADRQAPQGGRREPTLSVDHHDEPRFDEPRFDLDDDMDQGRRSADADWAPEPTFGDAPTIDAGFDEPRARAGRQAGRERGRPAAERPAVYVERSKPSRLPTLILLVLIGLLLGGIAALAWSQRSVVKDVIGDLISSAEGGAKPTLSENPEPAPASTKNADRLGGEPVVDAPKTVRTVEAQPAPGDQEVDPLAGVVAPEGTRSAAAEPAPAQPAPAAPPAAAADSNAGAADDSLVAQKAILYEQPTDGSQNVKVVPATATWKFNANSSNGPEIQAQLEVPEKGMKVTLNIRKNNDSALPASHLVEIVVDTPANFAGGGVKSVPALVMKPTEESRGQPLDGAAAKVADGFFWIAFSNDAQPMAQNVALLRERNWIDLPIVYNNDQRAILTFEKGTPGQRVFDKAMAAWGNN